MQVSIDYSEGLRCCVSIVFPCQEVNQRCRQSLQKLSAKANIKGFRAGKVPEKILKKRFGASVRQDVLMEWAQKTLEETLEKESIAPITRPNIEFDPASLSSVPEDTDIGCKITFERKPTITLVDAEGIRVDQPIEKVKAEHIEARLQQIRQNHAEYVAQSEAYISQEKDSLIVDYSGKIDGKAFAKGQKEDAHIMLGLGRYLPDFEAGLIGRKQGEVAVFPLQFPEDYGEVKLAGKSAQFEVKIKKISAQKLPELNEDFFKKQGIEPLTMGAFREDIKSKLEKEMQAQAARKAQDDLWQLWAAKFDFALPEGMIKNACTALKSQPDYQNAQAAVIEKAARAEVRDYFLVNALADKYALKVSEEEVFSYATRQMSDFSNMLDFMQVYKKDEGLRQEIQLNVLKEKAAAALLKSAQVNVSHREPAAVSGT